MNKSISLKKKKGIRAYGLKQINSNSCPMFGILMQTKVYYNCKLLIVN
jgi:hypothetical protein